MAVWDLIYNGGNQKYIFRAVTGTKAPTLSYPTGAAVTMGLDQAAAAAADDAWVNRNNAGSTAVYALVNTNGGSPSYQSFDFAIFGTVSNNNVGGNPVPLPAAVGVGFSMLGGFGMLAGLRKHSPSAADCVAIGFQQLLRNTLKTVSEIT